MCRRLAVSFMISFFNSAISLRVLEAVPLSGDPCKKSCSARTLPPFDLFVSRIVDSYGTCFACLVASSWALRTASCSAFTFSISRSRLANSSFTFASSCSYLYFTLSTDSFWSLSSLRSFTDSFSFPRILSRSFSYLELRDSSSINFFDISAFSTSNLLAYSSFCFVSKASFFTSSPILALSSGQSS